MSHDRPVIHTWCHVGDSWISIRVLCRAAAGQMGAPSRILLLCPLPQILWKFKRTPTIGVHKGCDVHMFFVEEIIEAVSSIAKMLPKMKD